MSDFAAANGLTPKIALLSSEAAERAAARNNLSFADLLVPFCTVQTTITDPLGQQATAKLQLDVRDIRRSGHLLSLTVLPSVLQETVRLSTQATKEDAWTAAFKQFFHYWLEPAEHDFLSSYICCIFVVSADDPDPLAELNRLVQQQNYQQHSPNDPNALASPAHCSIPKWFLPQILKFYLLVEDVSSGNEQKAAQIFASISTAYGQQFCHHLKLNSAQESNLPDPWSRFLNVRDQGLEGGLEAARREILNSGGSNNHALQSELSNLSITSVATVSSEIQKTAAVSTISPAVRPSPAAAHSPPTSRAAVRRGGCLETSDRDRVKAFVEDFVKNVLVPYVERQLVTQNEALVNRRGIGKSFTNMKKWLNVSGVTSTSTNATTGYTPESAEMQTRRLADLSFVFGLYAYSNSLYQTLKKDFLNDQAWLHHAGALEMCALSSFLASTPAQLKNYPGRYMDSAIDFYTNTCSQLLLALRCTLFSVEILNQLEKFAEAANQILRLTSRLPDLYGGVFLERAAQLFAKGRMFRKRGFHLVLAGHRFEKTGLPHLAFRCYGEALPDLVNKGWVNAEDNVLCVVVRDPALPAETRLHCNRQLIRPFCLGQSEEQQAAFLRNYVQNTRPCDGPSALPLLVGPVRTFCGEQPSAFDPADLEAEVDHTIFSHELGAFLTRPTWIDLERAAFYALRGPSTSFHPIRTFGNDRTDNSGVFETPPNERFTVRLQLVNPLKVPIRLQRLRLGFAEVKSAGESPFSFVSEIAELELPPISPPTSSEQPAGGGGKPAEVPVELSVVPALTCTSFTTNSLEFSITGDGMADAFPVSIPIELKRRRLFGKKEERLTKTYAVDNRLQVRVPQRPSPLLHFAFHHESSAESALELQTNSLQLFCSQVFQLKFAVKNAGSCDVQRVCVSHDQPQLIAFQNQAGDVKRLENKGGHSGVAVVDLAAELKVGEEQNFRLVVQAPARPVENLAVNLVFFYLSADQSVRLYRHRLVIASVDLVQASIRVLDPTDGLCALSIKNTATSRDTLAQIECTHLTGRLLSADQPIGVQLRPLSSRRVTVDTDQTDTYCFSCAFVPNAPDRGIDISDKQPERPPLPTADRRHLGGRSHLSFELFWRARITTQTGTISTIHGRNTISNPFLEFPTDDPLVLRCQRSANPISLLHHYLLEQSAVLPIGEKEVPFALTPEETYERAVDHVRGNGVDDPEIPWTPLISVQE